MAFLKCNQFIPRLHDSSNNRQRLRKPAKREDTCLLTEDINMLPSFLIYLHQYNYLKAKDYLIRHLRIGYILNITFLTIKYHITIAKKACQIIVDICSYRGINFQPF